MRVFLFFFVSFGFARSPSLQKCLSALANFDGFDGNSTIVVRFPKDYPEDELRKTVEVLGSLVLETTFYSDVVAKHKKIEEDRQRNYDNQVAKYNQFKRECLDLVARHDEENAKLWFWNKKPPIVQGAPYNATEEDQTVWNSCQKASRLSYTIHLGPPGQMGWDPRLDESTIKIKAF